MLVARINTTTALTVAMTTTITFLQLRAANENGTWEKSIPFLQQKLFTDYFVTDSFPEGPPSLSPLS